MAFGAAAQLALAPDARCARAGEAQKSSSFYGRMSEPGAAFWQTSTDEFRPDAHDLIERAIEATDHLRGALIDVELRPWSLPHRHLTGVWRARGIQAVLKLDVSESELNWAIAAADNCPELVPELLGTGSELGGHPVRWILQERLPWTLGPAWLDGADVEMMIDASVRFQKVAGAIPAAPERVQSQERLRKVLETAVERGCPHAAVVLLEALPATWSWLVATFGIDVIHGDLITPNVAVRAGPPAVSKGVLLDLAAARAPWPFEAAWPEGKNGTGHYRRLIPKMATVRARHGLPTPSPVDVERASALVMGWSVLGAHFARDRDPRNSPPDDAIEAYLADAVSVA